MYKSYIILAAQKLELIDLTTGSYGMSDTHITRDGVNFLEFTTELEETAKLLYKQRELRVWRDQKLSQTDWAVLPDALLDKPELKQQVIEYRQALRDFPDTITSLSDEVVYPVNPLVL
jgi:hypothetical protein